MIVVLQLMVIHKLMVIQIARVIITIGVMIFANALALQVIIAIVLLVSSIVIAVIVIADCVFTLVFVVTIVFRVIEVVSDSLHGHVLIAAIPNMVLPLGTQTRHPITPLILIVIFTTFAVVILSLLTLTPTDSSAGFTLLEIHHFHSIFFQAIEAIPS